MADGLSIVCVARIGNHAALAAELPVDAPTGSEAELLLSLYRHLGPESLETVDGEFALVIVDSLRDEIVLARDFFGFAPLYYAALPSGGFAFASEYKALLALPDVDPVVDRSMLQYLQHAKKLPVGRTLLTSVHAALPGTVATVTRSGATVATHSFRPLAVDDVIVREKVAVPVLRDALIDAVRRAADDLDPIGLALSGGIDSVGLAFVLRSVYPDREIHTFTTGYGAEDPEIRTAAQVAEAIGSVHHEVITSPALLEEELAELVWHLEDPFARSEVLQLFEIGKAAAGHVDVVLTGQGSDSLFGGMPRYRLLRLLQRLPFLRPSLTELYDLATKGLLPRRRMARLMARFYYRDGVSPVPAILGSEYSAPRHGAFDVGREFVNRQMAEGYQSGQALDIPKYERSFAASGVSLRSPYCDVEFARVAFRISDRLKIRGVNSKYILRRTLAAFMPTSLTKLPKRMQRMRCDLVFSRVLDGVADAVLSAESIEKRGFMAREEVWKLRQRDPDSPYPYESAMRLWTAILTEFWAREFLDRRGHRPDVTVDHGERELRRA
ncbi:MAG: asparagine synthetase B [Gemmatimonadota bacterium]